MGTWGSKPFENDTAADLVGNTVNLLTESLVAFTLEQDDDRYQRAIAAVAVLNRIMRDSPTRPWSAGRPYVGAKLCGLLAGYTTDNPHRAELEEFEAWTTPPVAVEAES